MFRGENEDYKDVVERNAPDILIEDDCESIGGAQEMTITHIRPEIRSKIKPITVEEFGGIDHIPDDVSRLKLTAESCAPTLAGEKVRTSRKPELTSERMEGSP